MRWRAARPCCRTTPSATASRGGESGRAHRLEGAFRVGGQEHFYLEGQVALAVPGEDGDMHRLFLDAASDRGAARRRARARRAGCHVTCEVRRMGGGFGGKESQATQWAALAALAAA